MKITPLEIRQKTFEKKLRGYDKDEVDAYLSSLSQEWERTQDEIREQKIRLELAEKEVQKLREVESSLFKTLKTAEDTGATLVDQARKKSQLMEEEARLQAEKMVQQAEIHARTIKQYAEDFARKTWAEVRNDLREAEGAFKALESHKATLMEELKHWVQDTVSKVDKMAKTTPIDFKTLLKTEFTMPEELAKPKAQAKPFEKAPLSETVKTSEPQKIEEEKAIVSEKEEIAQEFNTEKQLNQDSSASKSFFDEIA